jgi:phosphohistidine phosphatase SixA
MTHARPIAAAAATLALALTLALAPRAGAAQQDTTLLARLRRGGLVLACRHAITDSGPRPVPGDARSQERNLSTEGEEQAKRLGRSISALGIPIGTVLSSRAYRTRETAIHAFGRVVAVDSLQMPGVTPARVRGMLATPPSPGTNTVLVLHQGTLNPEFEPAIGGRVAEGECVVVRPTGAGRHEVLSRMPAEAWERLRR